MKINNLILAASKAYDADGVLGQCWDFDKSQPLNQRRAQAAGDGLASFICVELFETFDSSATDEAQIEEAVRVMTSAQRQVRAVIDAFENLGMPKCQRCGTSLIGGFCKDLTCPFSDHVQTCPVGWVGHPEHPEDARCTCGERIIATFVPQYIDDVQDCYKQDWVRFDVTEQILAMPRENAYEISDDRENSAWLVPVEIRDFYNGPFRVVVEEAIAKYFEKQPQKRAAKRAVKRAAKK